MENSISFQVYNASAGSGKTFTLVKEYLKILLKADNTFLFQKILAITFTNKAAGEMKERVLESLLEFSKQDISNTSNDMFEIMAAETGLGREAIKKKSKIILHNILQNYSSFHIKTIDSFTNKLIKSFAFDLGMSLDFEVELDIDAILNETIDVVISKIGLDKNLTNVLVAFAKEKTLEDRSWDIGRELLEISKLLLKENDIQEVEKLKGKNLQDFKALEKSLKEKQRDIEKQFQEIGKSGLEIIDDLEVTHKDFSSSDLPKFFIKLKDFRKNVKAIKFDGRLDKSIHKGILYAASKPKNVKSIIDGVSDELIQLYHKAEKVFENECAKYQLHNLVLKNIIPLAILNVIAKVLEALKTENNIRLNAEFNQIISTHLREQPAAFIYEKIGEKYKHFFIDEMQDTSALQWENLIPLIDNALSEANSSLLLVGDAKQAIYRWRGGKAEQFIDLATAGDTCQNNPFQIEKQPKNLETNFRSYSEIIDFNNLFFAHIAKYFHKEAYSNLYKIGNCQKFNKKIGGYVQLDFMEDCINNEERDTIFPEKIHKTILDLESEFDKNEICILVRKKSQGIAIANYLTDNSIDIVSSETLLVKNNSKVIFIINLLKYLKDKDNTDAKFSVLEFLHKHLEIDMLQDDFIRELVYLEQSDFFNQLENYQIYYSFNEYYQNPFYESIEAILRSFKLVDSSDAYLQFFLDFVFEFSQKSSQKSIDFLSHWEQKKDKLSIVASNNKNAVQIMTIHKSKGLEFPVVIFPYDLDIYRQNNPQAWYNRLDKNEYNGFESVLVNSTSTIESTGDYGKEIFKEQKEASELDNFNLLYVTLTRAKEQLYIITEHTVVKDKLSHYSHFFMDFLQTSDFWKEGKLSYSFGSKIRVSKKENTGNHIEIQQGLTSTSWQDHQINIVANSSLLWDTERGNSIAYGNLIHEMMANIILVEDVDKTVIQFKNKGFIEDVDQDNIHKMILKIVHHKQLKELFNEDCKVFTEREILLEDKQIWIPDRLNFNQNKVTVIDYKTGNKEKKHIHQVNNYALALQKMDYEIADKFLVYIGDDIEVVKV